MIRAASFALAVLGLAATPALADFQKVSDRSEFIELVQGKTLTRPLVKLEVSPDGKISGKGVRWDVTGNWTWNGGYFCRDLYWGEDALGYNCQEVKVSGGKLRFTSDKGAGDFADFRLR